MKKILGTIIVLLVLLIVFLTIFLDSFREKIWFAEKDYTTPSDTASQTESQKATSTFKPDNFIGPTGDPFVEGPKEEPPR